MGYDLHITRKESWFDEEGPKISFTEWVSYVALDPEIEADIDNPRKQNFVYISNSERRPLWWDERGEVYTKSPDDAMIGKLIDIAKALQAAVLGDENEIYGLDPSDPTKSEPR